MCGINYSTQQSFKKHCLKKGHKIDEMCVSERNNEKTNKTTQKKPVQQNEGITDLQESHHDSASKPNNNINRYPIILIPIINHPSTIIPVSTSHDDIITELGDAQRSLGCQTIVNTQETGSQTREHEISHLIDQQQQTQTTYTSAITSTCNNLATDIHDEYLHDAATSTSPLIDDIELFLNDISTQTGLDHFRTISIQTHESNMCNKNSEYGNLDQDYFSIETPGLKYTDDEQNSHQSSMKNSMEFNGSGCYGLNRPMCSVNINNNRCITPINMCNAPSQTEELYFNVSNTNSIQTQTNFQNGAETQTEFDLV